jgi:hypothetical protein
MKRTNAVAYLLFVLTAGCAGNRASDTNTGTTPPVLSTGTDVVAAMHDRYADTWYRTLRFRQTVTITRQGKEQPPQVWLEHASVPGYLRIDQAHDYNGNGVIYAPDTLYIFRNGKLTARRAERNPLMTLGFDVYRQPVARTVQVLQEAHYDLSKLRTDTWQGKSVYVIGADAGDLHSPQFWVEQDRLLFVRAFEPTGRDGSQTMEYQFNDYQQLAGGWIAVKCVFLTDGVEFDREEYFDIVANPELPAGLMDPAKWGIVNPE